MLLYHYYFSFLFKWTIFPNITPGSAGSPWVFHGTIFATNGARLFTGQTVFQLLHQQCQSTEWICNSQTPDRC